jgi:radical SAM protein with 4Fe4S-binding SPASM domain
VAGCHDTEHYVSHRLNDILAPYSEDPLFDGVKRERGEAQEKGEINCGTGWWSFSLSPDGTVRSCLFIADTENFGNIHRQPYEDIFRQPEMRWFHDAPFPGGAECRDLQPDGAASCRYHHACAGCVARAFRVSENEYPAGPWRAKYFPGMPPGFPKDVHLATSHKVPAGGAGTVGVRRRLCAT